MKRTLVVLGAIIAAASGIAGETNTHRVMTMPWGNPDGPQESIVKSVVVPKALASEQDRMNWVLSGRGTNFPARPVAEIKVPLDGLRVSLPVELLCLCHEVSMHYQTNDWTAPEYYELQIQSKVPGQFEWASWLRDPPHRFQVFTTESGTSYACAVVYGVQLWRLTRSRASENMRETYIKGQRHPDALVAIPVELIAEAVGKTNLIYGTTIFGMTVETVSDKTGALDVTLHGRRPEPKATFELREGKWIIINKPAD
jgi:hypothetical protein